MTRSELIQELEDSFGVDVETGCFVNVKPKDIAYYILIREKLLLSKIGKPLKDYKRTWLDDGIGWEWGVKTYPALEAIDEALAIIEKESV